MYECVEMLSPMFAVPIVQTWNFVSFEIERQGYSRLVTLFGRFALDMFRRHRIENNMFRQSVLMKIEGEGEGEKEG